MHRPNACRSSSSFASFYIRAVSSSSSFSPSLPVAAARLLSLSCCCCYCNKQLAASEQASNLVFFHSTQSSGEEIEQERGKPRKSEPRRETDRPARSVGTFVTNNRMNPGPAGHAQNGEEEEGVGAGKLNEKLLIRTDGIEAEGEEGREEVCFYKRKEKTFNSFAHSSIDALMQ